MVRVTPRREIVFESLNWKWIKAFLGQLENIHVNQTGFGTQIVAKQLVSHKEIIFYWQFVGARDVFVWNSIIELENGDLKHKIRYF